MVSKKKTLVSKRQIEEQKPTLVSRARGKISKIGLSVKVGRRAKQIEKNGIQLGRLELINFLEKASQDNPKLAELHKAWFASMGIGVQNLRPRNMRAYAESEAGNRERVLQEIKAFLESPEGLEAYAKYHEEIAGIVYSADSTYLGVHVAGPHAIEALSARRVAAEKMKHLGKARKLKELQ